MPTPRRLLHQTLLQYLRLTQRPEEFFFLSFYFSGGKFEGNSTSRLRGRWFAVMLLMWKPKELKMLPLGPIPYLLHRPISGRKSARKNPVTSSRDARNQKVSPGFVELLGRALHPAQPFSVPSPRDGFPRASNGAAAWGFPGSTRDRVFCCEKLQNRGRELVASIMHGPTIHPGAALAPRAAARRSPTGKKHPRRFCGA